jgi:predicted NAD/FAD-binding protein
MSNEYRRRVAIVGSGIAGMAAAHALSPSHEITVFEALPRVGGHANTVMVNEADQTLAIDTGFIVYNEPNYPGFVELLRAFDVPTQASEMSFSVSSALTGLEYRTSNLNTLLARRSNLLRPSFVRMLADIPRFNRAARELVASSDITMSLNDLLADGPYSRAFVDDYLIPLGASIWSADPRSFGAFPAAPLARFLHRHGLLNLGGRPQWRTVSGGSREYVRALTAPWRGRIRTGCAVRSIERDDHGVVLHTGAHPDGERFDAVLLSTPASVSLSLLRNPSTAEVDVLGAFRYQLNRTTLHTDRSLLPLRQRAWASWNYRRVAADQSVPVLTYYANRLQRLRSDVDYCITLNADEAIDPTSVIASFDYAHPVFDSAALHAQRRHHEIDGRLHTHYAGAYWGYGFHEDAVQSARTATVRLLSTASRHDRAFAA